MFDLQSIQTSLASVVGAAFGELLVALPSVVGAGLTIVLGIVLGNWSKVALIKVLGALQFDKLVGDTKLREFLHKAEVSSKAEVVVGTLVKWLVVLVFFVAATNILGLGTVSSLLAGVLNYIPSVLSATIVLAIGIFLAGLVERLVKGALASVDLHTARLMGKVASYTIAVIATLAAFSELKIAANFINIIFIGFVAMLSLGLGLAIGLGGKDLVRDLLSGWYKNLSRDIKPKK